MRYKISLNKHTHSIIFKAFLKTTIVPNEVLMLRTINVVFYGCQGWSPCVVSPVRAYVAPLMADVAPVRADVVPLMVDDRRVRGVFPASLPVDCHCAAPWNCPSSHERHFHPAMRLT